MTITLEELRRMELKGIRKSVPAKPASKDLKGINFPINSLKDKKIIVIDWLYLEKGSTINPEKRCVKFQFYLGDMLGVCFTSSGDFVDSLEAFYHMNGDRIVPFPTIIRYDGRRYTMEDIDQ